MDAETKNAGLRLLGKILLIILMLWAVFTFVLGIHINRGARMQPYVMDGDLVITYKPERCQVGDIVAYKNPLSGRTELSRIAAIGAHEVLLSANGDLLLDGRILASDAGERSGTLDGVELSYPFRMSDEGVFLLDDNLPEGIDSRVYGEIPYRDLLGKVIYLFRRRGF